MIIRIKALSVNKAWQGKRFKTKDYLRYEQMLFVMLPNNIIVPKHRFWITITRWYSNNRSDIDNPTKIFIDILSKKYKFDDKEIYQMILNKKIVKKWCEYIDFQFYQLRSSVL